MINVITTLEKIWHIFMKLNIHLPFYPTIPPWYLSKRNENLCPEKDLFKRAHRNFIHNSPKLERSQMPTNLWIDLSCYWDVKRYCRYTLQHGWILDYAEQKKTQKNASCDSFHIKYNIQIYSSEKVRVCVCVCVCKGKLIWREI